MRDINQKTYFWS